MQKQRLDSPSLGDIEGDGESMTEAGGGGSKSTTAQEGNGDDAATARLAKRALELYAVGRIGVI